MACLKRFEMCSVRIAVEREKMVPVEGDVHTNVFAPTDGVADVAVLRGMLRLQLHTDADGQIRMRGRGHETTVAAAQSAKTQRESSIPRRSSISASGWSLCTE